MWLVLRNGFFGLLDARGTSRKQIAALLVLKALAIPVFYYVYEHHYGGMAPFDSGKFYNDARVLNECAIKHPGEFVQLFLGVQDERAVTHEHRDCLDRTRNWLKGHSEKFFYNDNRIVIRLHTLLHFFAFDSWFPHAFFSCLMSFAGLLFLFRSVGKYFIGRELPVFVAICLFPSLWFFTGALLKEGMVVLVLGSALLLVRKAFDGRLARREYIALLLVLLVSCLLKPYLLLTGICIFTVCFFVGSRHVRYPSVILILSVASLVAGVSLISRFGKNESLAESISRHQRIFRGMAGGGIFLSGDTTYVQLPYDTSLIKRVDNTKYWFTIVRGAPFYYWEDSHNQDTLFEPSNTDTVTRYEVAFITAGSKSNFRLPDLVSEPLRAVTWAFYYGMVHPMFFSVRHALDLFASLENLLLLLSVIITVFGLTRLPPVRPFLLACLLFAVMISVLVALSSPNSGAVFRYRAPAAVFLLLSAGRVVLK